MQNRLKKWIAYFSIICITSICIQYPHAYALDNPSRYPINSNKKQVLVSSDPRIELISIMQMMIGAWPMTDLEFDYLREVQGTFFKYYGHPAITMFSTMWYNYGFSQEIPSTFMLHLSDPPEFKIQTPFTKEIIDKGGGERNLNDFLELLRDFAKESDFMDFYHSHSQFYQEITERVQKKLGTKNTIGMLEDYFGYTDRHYELIVVALFCEKGYGTHVDNQYFALIGPYDVDEKKETKKPYWSGPDELHRQLLISFSYAYVNPIIYEHRSSIASTDKLIKPITTQMRYQRILNWQSCLIEHIVRGVSLSFTLEEYGKDEAAVQRSSDIQEFFVYIDYITDWLSIYESNRFLYENFNEFYPVLFDNVRKLCECPIIPTMVGIENVSENGVQLFWKDNTTEPGALQIFRKSSLGSYDVIFSQEERNIGVWTDRDVEIGETYWYKIAINGEGGTIKSYAVKAEIPVYPPLSVEKVTYEVTDSKIIFRFSYPYKAEGFTLFEWNDGVPEEWNDIDTTSETEYEIEIDIPYAGDYIFYFCSYIKTESKFGTEEKTYSPPSNFMRIGIP